MPAAIVTGASRGLGLAFAADLLTRGYAVAGAARRESDDWRTLAANHPGKAHFLATDMADSALLDGMLAEALTLLGGDCDDGVLLINNAGVVTPIASVGFYPAQELAQAIAINLTAPMLLTDALLRHTDDLAVERRVLCISSGAAVKAYPGWGVYGSGKAGLDHFCRHVAEEQAEAANPARIAAIYPGVIDTDMQGAIRDSDPAQFPNKPRFEALKAEGGLSSPADAARRILDYTLSDRFGECPVLDIRTL